MKLKDTNGKKTPDAGDELAALSADELDAVTEPSSTEDPFALENLTVDGTTMEDLGIERPLLVVPVQKPNKQDFFRVHPDPSFSLVARVLELQAERETYLVTRAVWPMLPGETKLVKLVTYQSRHGGLALWPLKLVEEGNRETAWHISAGKASELALTKWCRMQSNMSTSSYEVVTSSSIPDPVWPETTMSELLRIAFQDGKLITNTDHPVVRQLMGE